MSEEKTNSAYRVLARKYRPSNFDDLIGHEAMVRTLSNALDSGRLAHAFVLTGTRGIGKTTTARIIARGLNCTGPDGEGGPTVHPCGECKNCIAIAEDRHQDVLEMDAASRTGVDDIRELIDGVRYLPVSGRYKIYIIDEVHMLSKNAFNALLKTLEEPPEHVKFIFATTEIRKIPITVLSRCQRFDLKRVDADTLASYFGSIAEKEQAEIENDALALIARSAEGSVRDGLSLLDQAIAHGDGTVTADQVRDMLGLADRSRMLDLLETVFKGNIADALGILRSQYDSGADPVVVIQDLLELTHWLTTLKVTPEAANNVAMSGGDVARGQEMAEKLGMPVLARTWQMLLKGLDEVRNTPMAIAAAEMILIRLAYASELPTPGDLARKIQDGDGTTVQSSGNPSGGGNGTSAVRSGGGGAAALAVSNPSVSEGPARQPATEARAHLSLVSDSQPEPVSSPQRQLDQRDVPQQSTENKPFSMEDIVGLLSERTDVMLKGQVINFVRAVKLEPGLLEFSPAPGAPVDLAARLGVRLRDITDEKWSVTLSAEAEGAPTVAEKRQQDKAILISAIERHPLVQSIKDIFEGASIRDVRDLAPSLEFIADDDISPVDENE